MHDKLLALADLVIGMIADTSGNGTKRPIRDVRYSAAIKGKADLARTCLNRRRMTRTGPQARFRTFQVRPKEVPAALWQAQTGGD